MIALSILLLTSLVSALSEHQNVALYWGQNSAGTQTTLASYCDSEDADIFILSFMHIFGYSYSPQVNFANACGDTYSDGLLHCSQIGEDIKTCQSLGKTILLSLGGASGAYGFADDTSATTFASTLWNMFGAGNDASVNRPFDDAIVDGFDFDIENNIETGYTALATELRTLFATDDSKTYYLSAAPQCPYPDASVGNLLANADLDFAFIQFYNNYCSTLSSNFNWNVWADFANTVSPNRNIKLFLGLPAAAGAAGSGYSTIDNIQSVFENQIFGKEDSNFAGFVLWDASWSKTNQVNGISYGDNLKNILNDNYSGDDDDDDVVAHTTTLSTSTLSTSSTSSSSTSSSSTSSSSTSSSSTSSSSTSTSSTSTSSTSSASSTSTSSTSTETTSTSSVETNVYITDSSSSVQLPNAKTVFPDTTISTLTTTSSTSSLLSPTATNNNKNSDDNTSTCSSLSGLEKAQCLNTNFANGVYLGSDLCAEGEIACSSDGAFSICNFGNWVDIECSSGTTCYAYNYNDQVDVGCNYIDSKSKFEKRSTSDDNASIFMRIKRHVHNIH